jgi:hypothetical protein
LRGKIVAQKRGFLKLHNPEEAGIDVSLLAHISPIEWSNVILYGEYRLNKDLVRS